jgi:hypothetical protein
VIENVNDSLTMAKAGVWADHVQVQKLSLLLKRPLSLYTFDDVSLRMDRQGQLRPGKDYMIGTEFEGSPISLYYTPSPGHYEVIMLPQPPELQASLDEEIAQIEHVLETTQPPHVELPAQLLCNVYFRLEAEAGLIEEISGSGWLSAREIKQAIEAELKERASIFFARFFRYRQIVGRLGVKYLIKYLENTDFNLHTEVLYSLLEPKPDSVESLLTKLSTRVTSACPAGVLTAAQQRSLAPSSSSTSSKSSGSGSGRGRSGSGSGSGGPPVPPAAPVKATPTPTPAVRPTTVVTSSPLLLAAYTPHTLTPMPATTGHTTQQPQAYCTLPPPLEGPLLASPTTKAEEWAHWCRSVPSNVLQLRDSFVTGSSLQGLAEALAGTRINYLMFYRCRFDVGACQVLGEVNAWPVTLQRIELHNCLLEHIQGVSLNNRVKPLNCSDVPPSRA